MAYVMNQACNPQALAEQEFATPTGLLDYAITTTLNSCIGVAVRVGNRFMAAHLVMYGQQIPYVAPANLQIFNAADADTVFAYIDSLRLQENSANFDEAILFGATDEWRNTGGALTNGYNRLRDLIRQRNNNQPPISNDTGDGKHIIRIQGGNLNIRNIG